jgi:hypothetical protein
MIITPTVGRVVWFVPHGSLIDEKFQPCAAIVAYVHSDRLVNLTVFAHNGGSRPETSVTLVQEGDNKPESGHYCKWMPYQIGQAQRHAQDALGATKGL